MMSLPANITLVDVGPRDGLQNEAEPISVDTRVELVNLLAEAGVPVVETGSFVSPKWVPQMASSEEVFAGIQRKPGTRYAALTPNLAWALNAHWQPGLTKSRCSPPPPKASARKTSTAVSPRACSALSR